MGDARDMVTAMKELTKFYHERGLGQAPSPWMGLPATCRWCREGIYPHLHRWEWVEAPALAVSR